MNDKKRDQGSRRPIDDLQEYSYGPRQPRTGSDSQGDGKDKDGGGANKED